MMGSPPPEPPVWAVLLTLMVHGPDPEPTLRGAIRSIRGDGSGGTFEWMGGGSEPRPVLTGLRGNADPENMRRSVPMRVWRDGRRLRIEEPGGAPSLLADDTTCWQFDREHDNPVAAPRDFLHYIGSGTELLTRRSAADFLGDDFTRPAGPTRFLGRPAFTVELAPPAHKPHPMQLVIDAETGIVLQQRNDGFDTVDEWVEFVVGDDLDPALFTWTGPTRTRKDQRAVWEAEERAEMARRPRSDEPWDLGWSEPGHRWSTPRWDWALMSLPDLTPAGLAALKRQLDGT